MGGQQRIPSLSTRELLRRLCLNSRQALPVWRFVSGAAARPFSIQSEKKDVSKRQTWSSPSSSSISVPNQQPPVSSKIVFSRSSTSTLQQRPPSLLHVAAAFPSSPFGFTSQAPSMRVRMAPAPATRVCVENIVSSIRADIQSTVARLKAEGISPSLTGLLANGEDAGARKYAQWTERACSGDGISFRLVEVNSNTTSVRGAVERAMQDQGVHGIIVYYPCCDQSSDAMLRDSLPKEKDVEGLCEAYRREIYRGVHSYSCKDGSLAPCTPHAILEILGSLGVLGKESPEGGGSMAGQTVTVINRSDIVGRPLAAMLANEGADVFSADVNGVYRFRRGRSMRVERRLCELVRSSDVVVTGVPTKTYKLPTHWVRKGAVVINVSNYKNVDEDEILTVPGVRYVPLVGRVTVAMLERNLLNLIEKYHKR